jgi:hypothetical protein
MKLLIPRISDATARKDMKNFVNRVLEKWLRLPFSSQPRIVSCKIISNTSSIGVIQRHGLINILPDDAALRLIRKLNGTTQGHPEAIEQKNSYLFHAGF